MIGHTRYCSLCRCSTRHTSREATSTRARVNLGLDTPIHRIQHVPIPHAQLLRVLYEIA